MTSYYISDEELFKDPPTRPNCPVCEVRLPVEAETTYMSCCGKVICDGCVSETKAANNWKGTEKCPLCKSLPVPKDDYTDKLAEHDDAMSNYKLGSQYFSRGDLEKSMELWHKSAEQGSVLVHHNLACSYLQGLGCEEDEEKAMYHWKLAAIGGDESSRHNLGNVAFNRGQDELAIKHLAIAANAGHLKALKMLFFYRADDDEVEKGPRRCGHPHVSKDEIDLVVKAYNASLLAVRTEPRVTAKKNIEANRDARRASQGLCVGCGGSAEAGWNE